MKINGVTVFQETLTMNPSLCAPTGRKTYTYTPLTLCMCNSTVENRTEISPAFIACHHGHNGRPHTKKDGKQNEAAKKAILTVTQSETERDNDKDDFIPFIAGYRHFCISASAFDPCHGTY